MRNAENVKKKTIKKDKKNGGKQQKRQKTTKTAKTVQVGKIILRAASKFFFSPAGPYNRNPFADSGIHKSRL